MITIRCNGQDKELAQGTTLSGLLEKLEIAPETVVVECNGRIWNPEKYSSVLQDNDELEVIRFVGGG